MVLFDWVSGYDRRNLKGDLIAGLTVGAMLIPQSMGYPLLAGLPPHVGLLSAVVPHIVKAPFRRSRHLGVGPTAISSLLTSAALANLWFGLFPGRPLALSAEAAISLLGQLS